jgi:hypothetical protein
MGTPAAQPGAAATQPQQPSRDPFAAAQAQMATAPQAAAIVDAGPQLDIPKEKKTPIGLIIGLLVTGFIALGVGWAFGGVMHARKVFNKTVDDAKKIEGAITDLDKVVGKIIGAIEEARKRRKAKKAFFYDTKLIDDLRTIQQSSPLTNKDAVVKLETKLFRTNYALMNDLLISRLFKYYYNSVRLMTSIDGFINFAEADKDKIEDFLKNAAKSGRKYGLYFSSDRPNFFVGGLTIITAPTCQDGKAWNKERKCQLGFNVSSNGKTWSWRPGKPKGKRAKITDIVVPIPPNDPILVGMTGRPGRMSFGKYMLLYRNLSALSALLKKDRKAIIQDLKKQGAKQKVWTL